MTGVSGWAIRFGVVLVSLFTCLMMGVGAFQVTRSRVWALWSIGLTGILPWYFIYSRLGFDAVCFPATLSVALISFWFAIARRESRDGVLTKIALMLSGAALALSLYAYSTARLFSILYLFFWRLVSPQSVCGESGSGRAFGCWFLLVWYVYLTSVSFCMWVLTLGLKAMCTTQACF